MIFCSPYILQTFKNAFREIRNVLIIETKFDKQYLCENVSPAFAVIMMKENLCHILMVLSFRYILHEINVKIVRQRSREVCKRFYC